MKLSNLLSVRAAALSATALSLAFAMPAHAQDAAADDDQGGIAEIVVTAQKVAENIRKLRTSATPNIANHNVVEGDRNPAVEEWQENQ